MVERSLYDKIRDLVKKQGTTLEALCKDVDFNVHTYKNTRADGRSLPFDIVEKMANKLGVDLSYFASNETTIKKVYISGPITGVADYVANFAKAEELLVKSGYEVVNPVTIGKALSEKLNKPLNMIDWRSFMKEDIKHLMDCDAIFMLDDWDVSKGAVIEYNLAMNLGIKNLEILQATRITGA